MKIIYFVSQIFLFLISYIYGKRSSRGSYNLYFVALLVAYTLVEGLRFGRGIDYNVYAMRFEDVAGVLDISTYESSSLIFTFIENFLVYNGLPYQCLIILCSFIFFYFSLKWLFRYRESLAFTLPLLFVFSFSAENLFRWYTGFAFILFAVDYLKDKNLKRFILYSLIAVGFHIMLVPFIIIVFFLSKLRKPICNPLIASILYLIVLFAFKTEYMLTLSSTISYILNLFQNAHYHGYSDSINTWITGSNRDLLQISILRDFINYFTYMFFVYAGRKVIKYRNDLLLFYNLMIVGVITYPALRQIELFDRYNQLFLFYIVIIGGFSLYHLFTKYKYISSSYDVNIKNPYKCSRQIYFIWGIFVILNYSLLVYNRATPTNDYYTMFIWDANGKTYIPTSYLLNKR